MNVLDEEHEWALPAHVYEELLDGEREACSFRAGRAGAGRLVGDVFAEQPPDQVRFGGIDSWFCSPFEIRLLAGTL